MTRGPSLSHVYLTSDHLPWGARHPWLRDPDGHPVSLCSSTDDDAK